MARPVTLFTGQWADLKIADMARKGSEFGYDGLELACWGDHFEVDKAIADKGYCAPNVTYSASTICKFTRSAITWPDKLCWTSLTNDTKRFFQLMSRGDGSPAGVNKRAAEEMMNTARATKTRR